MNGDGGKSWTPCFDIKRELAYRMAQRHRFSIPAHDKVTRHSFPRRAGEGRVETGHDCSCLEAENAGSVCMQWIRRVRNRMDDHFSWC